MSAERFEWYYIGDTGQLGPLSEAQILDLAQHSVLTRETLVWKVGMESWVPAGSVPMLANAMQPKWTPPAVPQPPPVQSAPAPPAPTTGRGSAACPRDGSPLHRESRSGVEIDWCPTCRGVWLDRGELEKLIDREKEDYDDDDRGRGRKRRGFDLFDIFD